MTKEVIFDNVEEVTQAALFGGCLSFFCGGGIGLGIGWMFMGFLQGLGLGLVTAFVLPLICCPVLFYICSKYVR